MDAETFVKLTMQCAEGVHVIGSIEGSALVKDFLGRADLAVVGKVPAVNARAGELLTLYLKRRSQFALRITGHGINYYGSFTITDFDPRTGQVMMLSAGKVNGLRLQEGPASSTVRLLPETAETHNEDLDW